MISSSTPHTHYTYLSVSQLFESKHYPFSMGQIRNLLAMRDTNGLGVSVRKIGKRLYLRQDLLEQWIEDNYVTVKGTLGDDLPT